MSAATDSGPGSRALDLRFTTTLGSFHADIALSSELGETTVVLGESGSGKTTVLRVLAGLLSPDDGRFKLDDTVYLDTGVGVEVPPEQREIGYVFQDYALFPHLSVRDNVGFGLRMQRVPRKEARQRIAEALEQVHLVGYDERRPGQLSGGQQQRVAIARALVLRPRLLLLDESLSALDIQTRRQVVRELRELLAELNLTTVMVSHQYSDALALAHRIVVLEQGRVVQQGNHVDLLRAPMSAYVAELVGVNRLSGTCLAVERDLCRVAVQPDGGGAALELLGALGPGADSLLPGDTAVVVVHPRDIILGGHPPAATRPNTLRGTVAQAMPVSVRPAAQPGRVDGLIRVGVTVGHETVTADVSTDTVQDSSLAKDATVCLSFAPESATVLPRPPDLG